MKILITGIGGPAGGAAARCLNGKHFIIGADMDPAARDRCPTDRFYTVPPGKDINFTDSLLKISRDEKVELIVPTVDEELFSIASNADNFRREGIALFISPPETIETCQDKYRAYTEFCAKDVPAPRSCLPSELAASGLAFPLLVKPRVGRGGRGITVVNSHMDIETLGVNDSFMIQEFASGIDYDGVALVKNGDPIELHLLRKTVLEHGNYGNALETVEVFEEDVLALLRRIIGAFVLEGPIDIDARRTGDGVPVAIEINPRVGAHIHKVPSILEKMTRGESNTGHP